MADHPLRAPHGHLTLYEVAARVGVHHETIRAWLRPGKRHDATFPVPRIVARRLAFVKTQVDAWIARQPQMRSVRPTECLEPIAEAQEAQLPS